MGFFISPFLASYLYVYIYKPKLEKQYLKEGMIPFWTNWKLRNLDGKKENVQIFWEKERNPVGEGTTNL